MKRPKLVLTLALVLSACAGEDLGPLMDSGYFDAGNVDAGMRDTTSLPYAREVVSFTAGDGAGYGRDRLPNVVVGPPDTSGPNIGSLDVLSLGVGGSVVMSFGSRTIVDGPGADFVVFENAFFVNGAEDLVFAELGEVAVSTDAATWHTFACDADADPHDPGCAGWRPTRSFDPFELPLDPAVCGGDPFDLADLGLPEVRYVRLRDLATDGVAPTAGFDLDGIGLVHTGEAP